MKTEYLREFAVFSRYLSFTDAAKELFIAQSTLSTHIAALESDVGFSLIDRKAGNRLTDKGAVFLDGARTLLDGLDETLARCREMGDPDATLRIAVQYPRPRSQPSSKSAYPCPLLSVEHDYRDPIFQPIVNGTADIVLDYDYTPFASLVKEASALDLVTRTCLAFRMSISMMASNPLASRPALSRNDLSGASIIINDAHNYDRIRYLYERMLGDNLDRTSACSLQRHERSGLRHLRRWAAYLRAVRKPPLVRRPRRRGALRRARRKAPSACPPLSRIQLTPAIGFVKVQPSFSSAWRLAERKTDLRAKR